MHLRDPSVREAIEPRSTPVSHARLTRVTG